ncbi:MAG: cysteine desulfurase family protein [Sphaerochaetaceae bacterium]|nr:cysteine desulfurase family protein [Sphaerochaetaceae bacterium]
MIERVMDYQGYFDWAATTPISELAASVYIGTAREYIGNPSSIHREGQRASRYLLELRQDIARLVGADAKSITFTSGGTESDAIILNSLLRNKAPGQVIIPRFEHAAVTQYAKLLTDFGWEVRQLQTPGGYVTPQQIAQALTEKTRLVCCMLVNNVTGTRQDVASIAGVLREYSRKTGRNIHFHCDAVQALGKIPIDLKKLGVDSAAFSAHKFCGPRGVGFLYNTNSAVVSLSRGGGQENGLRPGTENLAGIASMTAALNDATMKLDEHFANAVAIKRYFEQRFAAEAPGIVQISPSVDSEYSASPYILSFSAQGLPSEVFTRMLFDQGFCVSSGSACSNNAKQKGDGILQAMGFDAKLASSAVRLSYGYGTTLESAERLADAIISTYLRHAPSRFTALK